MSQQAVDILQRWMADAVRPVSRADIPKEASRLATEFTAYAEDAGLNLDELVVDLGEDIATHMADALEAMVAEEDALVRDGDA